MRSQIVLHDSITGHETVVHDSPCHIEAPNWSPCGSYLLVNSKGRLYRIMLAEPALLHLIDTGPLVACNNDHGISPDGLTLAISNSPGRGTSVIYTLATTGAATGAGGPRQLTPLAPSWWHGWSPDAARHAYTARRGGVFHICTCAADGSDEQVLTTGPGHRDGPDYTADGQWIWFNSDHHGPSADLWRIRPDGSALQQMTDDDHVNWFPHPAPKGGPVLYLAYPPGTTGHPGNLPVALRLLPAGGGVPRTLVRFNGGQGAINVPCWAPDGRRFAYARHPRA